MSVRLQVTGAPPLIPHLHPYHQPAVAHPPRPPGLTRRQLRAKRRKSCLADAPRRRWRVVAVVVVAMLMAAVAEMAAAVRTEGDRGCWVSGGEGWERWWELTAVAARREPHGAGRAARASDARRGQVSPGTRWQRGGRRRGWCRRSWRWRRRGNASAANAVTAGGLRVGE